MSLSHSTVVFRLAAITAVYYAAGRVGLSLAFVNENASAVWPPSGIAIASLLLGGYRFWPAVFIGALLVNVTTTGWLAASAAIASGNTLEAVAGAWLLRRFAGGARAFERAGDIFKAAALTTAIATPIAASIGTATLLAAGLASRDEASAVWTTWWLGDAAGVVTVAPVVLLWARRPWFAALRQRPVEALILFVTIVGVTLAVFGGFTQAGREHWALTWLCLPVLLWPALRFSPRECVAATAIVSVLAIHYTLDGFGPFASHPPNRALLMLHSFLGVMMLTTLATAAEAGERRARERDLRLLNQELESRVATRTADLARLQSRLEEAQRIARIGSWEWDIVNDQVWWSDELYRIYGRPPDTPVSSYQEFLACVHPEDVADVQRHVSAAVEGGERQFEHRVVRPDGTGAVVSARAHVVRDAGGRAIRLRGTAQDISEQRRAEEASRAKDQFMATLSHELRTPLNAVLGWAHMLLRGTLAEGARERALELIYRNATIQAQLVSDMLDISRMTAGDIVLNIGLVDWPSLVESAVETVRPSAVEKGISLEVDLDETAWVEGDAKRLAQVMNNLLNNAIKFTPPDGQVSVSLKKQNGSTILAVRDTGPGIPPDFMPHVFDRFRQADDSVTRAHGGLGLGLAIVRHIVERHAGSVSVANGPDGRGAVFTVRLPALAPKNGAAVQG